ncbi:MULTISPECIES: sulfite exporter TauE/SafE family protein [Vibrio]|uniref:Probable membrane transporter protein n=1 Tax=Vibrio algicola TaxID=2662262 RepID=A0A5Q0TGB5_9VIBR|nr:MULTISPECIES: sulfite exporter TauE/SafE family protein [Vibrio]MBD1577636.1 sulfite exporter TauE/SafE family protein [Vibrio sp. S11_S32]
MLDFILHFKPDILSDSQFYFLILLSGMTSMLNTIIGVGGGATLIAFMITMIPAQAVIPVHAVVQLGSNAGRAFLMRKYIERKFLGWYFVGAVIGAIIGGQLALNLPTRYLELILAVFILISSWVPINLSLKGTKGLVGIGFLTTFLSMFVGATGPLLIATVKNLLPDRRQLGATMACFMSMQHTIKVVVFAFLGFAFKDWIGVIALMIACGFVGTYIGKRILYKVSNQHFHTILKVALTFIALRLIVGFFTGSH